MNALNHYFVAAAVVLVGCGGAEEKPAEVDGTGGAGGAQASTGGSTSSTASGGSTASSTTCPSNYTFCTSSCSVQYGLVVPTCVGTEWVCPASTVSEDDCPADSCAVGLPKCCDSTTGATYFRSCGSDGYLETCAAGSNPAAEWNCVPESLGAIDCTDLDGQPCSGPALYCESFVGMMVSCECLTDFGWSCSGYLGP